MTKANALIALTLVSLFAAKAIPFFGFHSGR